MKYDLVGIDGNAFSIMGYVVRAMSECCASSLEIIDKCNEIVGGAE